MKTKLVKLGQFSGSKASIYGVWIDDLRKTSFDTFVENNKSAFISELSSIASRLITIGNKTGAREQFFKINEGVLGDGVCALYDDPDKKLRLYCIRYGSLIVIIGGGGEKTVRALQQDDNLKTENYFLRELSSKITERLNGGEIRFSCDKMDFEGNLEFNDEDYE